ncbi:protein of unknown function [Burkholderia multivorans]
MQTGGSRQGNANGNGDAGARIAHACHRPLQSAGDSARVIWGSFSRIQADSRRRVPARIPRKVTDGRAGAAPHFGTRTRGTLERLRAEMNQVRQGPPAQPYNQLQNPPPRSRTVPGERPKMGTSRIRPDARPGMTLI